MAKTLNLTPAEKDAVKVGFAVNEFVVTFGENEALFGTYPNKAALKQALAQNGVKNAKFTGPATNKYLANYGNPVF